MKKAVAVPYIIALILGVAVVGLVGYWFATTGGKFGGQSAKTVCDNKFLQWCITTGGSLALFITSNSECTGLVSYTACSELVSGGGGLGGGGGGSGGGGGGNCGTADTHGNCDNNQYCNGNSCVACESGTSPDCSGDCNKCGEGWTCPLGGKCKKS